MRDTCQLLDAEEGSQHAAPGRMQAIRHLQGSQGGATTKRYRKQQEIAKGKTTAITLWLHGNPCKGSGSII